MSRCIQMPFTLTPINSVYSNIADPDLLVGGKTDVNVLAGSYEQQITVYGPTRTSGSTRIKVVPYQKAIPGVNVDPVTGNWLDSAFIDIPGGVVTFSAGNTTQVITLIMKISGIRVDDTGNGVSPNPIFVDVVGLC